MARAERVAWFAEEKVLSAVQLEPALVILSVAALVWLVYKFLLRKVSFERHQLFKNLFENLLVHVCIGVSLYGAVELLRALSDTFGIPTTIAPYVAIFAVVSGMTILVKLARVAAFEYLFFTSMKAGVPALLVNIFTLILSLLFIGLFLTRFMQVDLTPLLATSAILSIVLGMALQDTLGNLFAGIALQLDKPFELGDWVELKNAGDRIVGQVEEVTWRATVLLAVTDELIVIPNRNMAQWQVSNFAGRHRPFTRSHIFRIPYGAAVDTAKIVLLSSVHSVPGIVRNPPPVVFVMETTESWVALRVVYSIDSYGSQWSIADNFYMKAIHELEEAGIPLASNRLYIESGASAEKSPEKS